MSRKETTMAEKKEKKKPGSMSEEKGPFYQCDENGNITAFMIALTKCPPIDFTNPDEIEEGIKRYLDLCYRMGFKPAITSFAVCAHENWKYIQHIRYGHAHRNIRSMKLLKELQDICEAATREQLAIAKNPSGFIFELKCHYGWSDVPQMQIEQREDINENTSMTALAAKYLDSIVVDDHQLVKIKEPPIEEVESTAVIVEDNKEAE